MKSDQQKIKWHLSALVVGKVKRPSSIHGEAHTFSPATAEQIVLFKKRASDKQVPQIVIDQLIDLYEVADHFYYDIVLGFHSCDDETIFAWWDEKELWLGQRDFYTLRWAKNKFCLGDVTNISFSSEHEYDTLIGLIEGCLNEIKAMNHNDKSNNHDQL